MLKTILKEIQRQSPWGLIALLIYRFGNIVYYKIKIPIIRHILWFLYRFLDIFIARTLTSSEINAKAQIGKDIVLCHGANGIIVSPKAIIGDNVTIFHQVTIGQNSGSSKEWGAPKIGNNVLIGAGAKIIGPITIEDNVKIGANAVVVKNIPADSIAVGIPAKVIIND